MEYQDYIIAATRYIALIRLNVQMMYAKNVCFGDVYIVEECRLRVD